MQDWPQPTTKKAAQSFLGLANYYREFIDHYADMSAPLNELTKKNTIEPFTLNDEQKNAFEVIKNKLCTTPVLALPTETGRFVLDTDASDVAVAAVLHQEQWDSDKQEMVLKPIAYMSKTMSPTECNYGTPKQEMLAVMVAVKKFRPFLVHQEFTLRTDYSALGWLKRWSLHEGGMIARWILHLNSFSMKFEHRPRAHHKNADGLTRMLHHLDKPGFSPSDPARMPGFKFLTNNQEVYHELPEPPDDEKEKPVNKTSQELHGQCQALLERMSIRTEIMSEAGSFREVPREILEFCKPSFLDIC